MPEFKVPAPDAPAEEWGRLAVSIPGFTLMPGMMLHQGAWFARLGSGWEWDDSRGPILPDPDDLTGATEGCLLRLLGGPVEVKIYHGVTIRRYPRIGCLLSEGITGRGSNLGRACIAAAAAIGRWPGGAS